MKASKIILFLFLCFSLKAFAEQPAWELVSMTPPRGLIYFSETTPDIMFLYLTNIFYSTNNGDSWIWTGEDNCWRMIYNNNTLFVSKRFSTNTSYPKKLYKSSDFGKTWVECQKGLITGSHTLAKGNNLIITMVQGLDYLFYLYTSSDNGENWEFKNKLEDTTITWYFNGLKFRDNILISWGRALQATGSNIKLSLDTGRTWENINFPFFEISNVSIISGKEIYCFGNNSIYLSDDTCKTWKVPYFKDLRIADFLFNDDKSRLVVSVDGKGIYFSNDSGKTWEQSEEFKNYPNRINTPFLFSQNENIFCFPSQLAPFRSTDFGKTWEEVSNGFSSAPPYDFIINPYGEMYISHFGIFKSTNEGRKFNFQGMRDFSFETMAYNSKGYIYACMANYNFEGNNGIYRSKDGGKTWDFHYLANTDVSSIIIDEIDYIYITKLTGGVYRSTDDGETWKEVFTPGGSLGVNDEGHIFNFMHNFIYRSLDKGDSWEEVGAGEYDPTLREFHGRIIFNNKTKTAAYYGLVTIDNGRSWWNQEDYGYSFGQTDNENFAVDSSYNWIYSGIYPVIIRSTDNGKTWYQMDSTGLKHSKYTRPAVSPNGHIYVFGATGGLYRSRDRFVSVEEQMKITYNPNELFRSDIYEIEVREWELYGRDNSIKIYNTLGECVLSDEFENDLIQNGGTKQVNISSLPPGVYFIRYLWAKKIFVKAE